jgi:Arc/MetJ-type ribon-helix-helix transcriptional regulator
MEVFMKTVQMTLDEDLVNAIDAVSKQLHTNRSAFTRMALREALARYDLKQLERKHRQGYEKDPVTADEFLVWEDEQAWGDERNMEKFAGTGLPVRTKKDRFLF